MANTGYSWSAWAYVQQGASDWNDNALADNGTETSDAIDLTGKISARIGITLVEDNTGAIDGVVTVYVLQLVGDDGGAGDQYEEPGVGSPWSFTITPVQNDTVRKVFAIDAALVSDCKIAIKNEGGQELAVTVEIQTCDMPAAS